MLASLFKRRGIARQLEYQRAQSMIREQCRRAAAECSAPLNGLWATEQGAFPAEIGGSLEPRFACFPPDRYDGVENSGPLVA